MIVNILLFTSRLNNLMTAVISVVQVCCSAMSLACISDSVGGVGGWNTTHFKIKSIVGLLNIAANFVLRCSAA